MTPNFSSSVVVPATTIEELRTYNPFELVKVSSTVVSKSRISPRFEVPPEITASLIVNVDVFLSQLDVIVCSAKAVIKSEILISEVTSIVLVTSPTVNSTVPVTNSISPTKVPNAVVVVAFEVTVTL